jgi:putative phosphoribosyl transferase
MRFKDREHAGRLLAARLGYLRGANPVVLGLTRGGIPVAFEVAHGLEAPLDLVVVRKLRSTETPELSFGALAERGVTYLNPTLMRDARMRHEDAAVIAEGMVAELARHIRLYRGETPPPSLHGRPVVVVDDFVTTGTSARAAALAARKRGATRVLLAVPVLSAAVEPELKGDFDEIVVLEVTDPARPASEAYERLEDVSDETAIEYLRRARLEQVAERLEPAGLT